MGKTSEVDSDGNTYRVIIGIPDLGPIYSILMEPILQEKIEQILIEFINSIDSRFLSTKSVFSEQLIHMSEIALSKFVSGIAKTALIVSIFSTAFIVGCMAISKLHLTGRQK